MLSWLKKLSLEPEGENQKHDAEHVAMAVLMFEVARADFSIDAVERQALMASLRQRLQLQDAAFDELMEYAEVSCENAVEVHANVRCINESLSAEEKRHLVQGLWEVAFADGVLDKYEEHAVGRLSDLLYVPRSDVIRLREKVRDRA